MRNVTKALSEEPVRDQFLTSPCVMLSSHALNIYDICVKFCQ